MKRLPLFLLTALVASPASALTSDHCSLLLRTPRHGATNVSPSTSVEFSLTQCPEPTPRLLAPDDAEVDIAIAGPTTSGDRKTYVLTPRAALSPGQYRLDLGLEVGTSQCGGETVMRAGITSFTVGPDPKLLAVSCQLSGGTDSRVDRAWVFFSEELAKETTAGHFEIIPAPSSQVRDGVSWLLDWNEGHRPRSSARPTPQVERSLRPRCPGAPLRRTAVPCGP